jgi:hypothetical protein
VEGISVPSVVWIESGWEAELRHVLNMNGLSIDVYNTPWCQMIVRSLTYHGEKLLVRGMTASIEGDKRLWNL